MLKQLEDMVIKRIISLVLEGWLN